MFKNTSRRLPAPAPAQEGFTIQMLRVDRLAVIQLSGSIGLEHSEAFEDALLGMLDRIDALAVLDLRRVEFINVIGLGVIARLGNALTRRESRLAMCGANPNICKLIRTVRLHEVFPPLSMASVEAEQVNACRSQLAICA